MTKHLFRIVALSLAMAMMFCLAQAQPPRPVNPTVRKMQEQKRKQLGEKAFQDWLKATGQQDLTAAPLPSKPAQLSPDEEALIENARKGDIKQLTALLDKGVRIKIKNKLGETPLGAAAAFREYEVFDLLLSKGANINDTDMMGTPLWWAAKKGDMERINWLLEHGADPTVVVANRLSATAIATVSKHPEIAQLLIAKGAKPDVYTCAQIGDHKRLAELLKDNPALAKDKSIIEFGPNAISPLHLATEAGHAEAVDLLLRHGADIWIRRDGGQRPFDLCPTVAVLKQFAANPDFLKSRECGELVTNFLSTNRVNLAQYLMGLGVLPSNTAQLLVDLDLDKDAAALKLLLDNGAINTYGGKALRRSIYFLESSGGAPFGVTPPEFRVIRNPPRALWLIEKGCPLDQLFPVNAEGEETSALNLAIKHGEMEIVKALLNKGVNLTPQIKKEFAAGWQPLVTANYCTPPLIEAAYAKRLDMAKLLVEHGVDVNSLQWNRQQIVVRKPTDPLPTTGCTALHVAALLNDQPMAEFLLSKGANPNIRFPTTSRGKPATQTPAQVAAEKGHTEIVKLLEAKE